MLQEVLPVAFDILIPQILDGAKREAAESKMEKIAQLLGINDKKNFYPYELSGGEKLGAARRILYCNDMHLFLFFQHTIDDNIVFDK